MKTILVPVDDSPAASHALPFAASLAHAAGLRVVLVRALPVVDGADPAEVHLRAMERAESEIGATAAALRGSGLDACARVLVGDPVSSLVGAALREDADLIVMSAHGWHAGPSIGSQGVARAMLRLAPVPVMMVPLTAWQHPGRRLARLVVPLDGSALAEAALTPAVSLAVALGAALVLLRVVDTGQPAVDQQSSADGRAPFEVRLPAVDSAVGYLAGVASRLGGRVQLAACRIEVGDPAAAIARVARAAGVAGIVMSTHGRGAAVAAAIGSVAAATVDRARVPVVVVTPRAAAAQAA
jgi:nucleotide-binding universal stress UspA family protein